MPQQYDEIAAKSGCTKYDEFIYMIIDQSSCKMTSQLTTLLQQQYDKKGVTLAHRTTVGLKSQEGSPQTIPLFTWKNKEKKE